MKLGERQITAVQCGQKFWRISTKQRAYIK